MACNRYVKKEKSLHCSQMKLNVNFIVSIASTELQLTDKLFLIMALLMKNLKIIIVNNNNLCKSFHFALKYYL